MLSDAGEGQLRRARKIAASRSRYSHSASSRQRLCASGRRKQDGDFVIGLFAIAVATLLRGAAMLLDLKRYAERDSDPLPHPEDDDPVDDRLPVG